jgi:hypothetical protein
MAKSEACCLPLHGSFGEKKIRRFESVARFRASKLRVTAFSFIGKVHGFNVWESLKELRLSR